MSERQKGDQNGLELMISCDDPETIFRSIDNVCPHLDKVTFRNLDRIALQLFQKHGKEGLLKRFNNRTVGSLLQEYEEILKIQPIVSGEINGMKYELYPAPDETSNCTEHG